MPTLPESCPAQAQYELRFQSLHHEGSALVFPCDAAGQVDLDRLSARARNDYLLARVCIGREFSTPALRRSDLH